MSEGRRKGHTDRWNPRVHALFEPPQIPREEWCDFRIDYENGMTLLAIGEKYHCDARTVKRCILLNKPSSRLGQKSTPTRLSPYRHLIRDYVEETWQDQKTPLTHRSRELTGLLQQQGYEGCERTVRNCLSQLYTRRRQSQVTVGRQKGERIDQTYHNTAAQGSRLLGGLR